MSEKDIDKKLSDKSDVSLKKPSLNNLNVCANEFAELLDEYGSELAPRIVEYEVEICEFPIEVLNEIRAIYAHIYRASIALEESDAVNNIEKAKSHSKRAVLDCYKYLCVAYDKRFHEFYKKFGYINWTKSKLINDVMQIDKIRANAVEKLKDAKVKESTERIGDTAENSGEDYRKLYKEAYSEYISLIRELNILENKIVNSQQIKSRFPAQVSLFIGIIGMIIGIIVGFFL